MADDEAGESELEELASDQEEGEMEVDEGSDADEFVSDNGDEAPKNEEDSEEIPDAIPIEAD